MSGQTTTVLPGPSTGAVDPADPGAGLALARAAGCAAVEVSALHEAELPRVQQLLRNGPPAGFTHVSVHAPLKGRVLPEAELVARLDDLALPVVAHPPTVATPARWRRLGDRLLLENDDSRKPSGRSPGDVDRLFDQLPQARHCLDLSHAADAGGADLALELAHTYRDRVAQLHLGCGCGTCPGPDLEAPLLGLLTRVVAALGAPVPVILERGTGADRLPAQLRDVAGAVRAAGY